MQSFINEPRTIMRQPFINELREFIDSATDWLKVYVKNVGWNVDEFKNVECRDPIVVCPYNAGHRVPQSSLEKHVETCAWIQEGYSKEEKDSAIPSSHFFHANSTTVVPVLIDKVTQANILKAAAKLPESGIVLGKEDKNVPRTMERAVYELSPQERLAIYEYVVAKAKETNKQSAVKIEDLQINFEKKNEQGKREKTHLELLAEQRDYKRRRQSYRAKNVHITKKSYTEVMREVIQNQMDLLEDLVREDNVSERIKNENHSGKDCKHGRERYSSRNSPSRSGMNSSSKKYDHRSSRHRHYERHSDDRDFSRDRHHKHHKHKKSHRRSSSSDDS